MKFFIDFEATQYSEYIISIGCVSEAGKEFSTLVKPPVKKKLTSFVTAFCPNCEIILCPIDIDFSKEE